LAELSSVTGIPRPTAHRLATALEQRRYLGRFADGRFCLGPRITELASSEGDDWLVRVSTPILTRLRDTTAASAQLYRRRGEERLCVASVEPVSGLRDSVPAGTVLPMAAGSAAQVMVAWSDPEEILDACRKARFTPQDLARVRRRGWSHTVGEREPGLASVSAPVMDDHESVVAAVSVSGPVERIGRTVKPQLAAAVLAAADQLSGMMAAR
jgi:DNA-binding IclR family transcriptional regulator